MGCCTLTKYAFIPLKKMNTHGKSPILTTTITLQRLKKRGYESLLDVSATADTYYELNPFLGARLELVEGNRRMWGGALRKCPACPDRQRLGGHF